MQVFPIKGLGYSLLCSILLPAFVSATAWACPFCEAVQMTFTEEVDASDVAVLAELVEPPLGTSELDALDPEAAVLAARAKFRIVDILKPADGIEKGQMIESLYFGEELPGARFLLMGVDPPETQWSTPILMSPRTEQYAITMLDLPRKHLDRLLHAIDFLEDEEEALRRDSYDEFAQTPYDIIQQLRGKIDHDRLIEWIKDPETPATRRRLYFTLLGVNGSEADLPLLEAMITSGDRQQKSGLDSMIACYVQLGGPETLPLIEETFLSDEEAEYTDTYAAIMALRFHGEETDVVPRERLVQSFRLMLDRPKLADLVIPDLARWEDWDAMPKMVQLFKDADASTSWVRVPVVNYLRACPLPEAQEYLEQLAEIDADAVRRASTFFPFSAGTGVTRPDPEADAEAQTPAEDDTEDRVPDGAAPVDAVDDSADESAAAVTPAEDDGEEGQPAPVTIAQRTEPPLQPATVWLAAVPIALVSGLLLAFVLILRAPTPAERGPAAAER